MSSVATGGVREAGPSLWAERWRGVRACLPMVIGIIPFAMLLGAQATQKGLSVLELGLMTSLNFAGGSEFAALEVWTSPPKAVLIAGITLLVNCRHMLMGAALAPHLRHLPKLHAAAVLFFMCDESWAMGMAETRKRELAGRSPHFSVQFYAGVAAALYLMWVAFTILGAVIGPVLGDVHAYGFDMAFPAVFLVLLRGMWKGFRAARPWLVSLLVAAGTYLWVPGAWYVVAGAFSGMICAFLWAGKGAQA